MTLEHIQFSEVSGSHGLIRNLEMTRQTQILTHTRAAVRLAALENGLLWKQKGSFSIIRNLLSGRPYPRHLTFITLFNLHKTVVCLIATSTDEKLIQKS